MLAIWRAVQEEIHCRGAKSVRQACTRLYEQRAGWLMKFVDQEGNLIDVINTASGADTLRQRYQVAERCRHDALRYPMLHASTAHLDAILPGTFERLKAAEPEWLWRKKTNNWIDNFPG
jgi:hypothetical protein